MKASIKQLVSGFHGIGCVGIGYNVNACPDMHLQILCESCGSRGGGEH